MPHFPGSMPAAMAVAATLVLGSPGLTQSAQVVMKAGSPQPRVIYPAIQGFYVLRLAHVQDELGLTDQQTQKLQELATKYYDDVRQSWSAIRELSADERRKKYAEIRKKNEERAKLLRAEIEKVLLPQQLEQLKEINLRSRAPQMLQRPQVLQQMNVDGQQRGKLDKLQQAYQEKLQQFQREYQEKISQLQKESIGKFLEVLTAEQRKQLKQLTEQGSQ